MKKTEKELAQALRREGKSLNEIAKIVGVSKASVSKWVRDIELSVLQRNQLTSNGFSVDAIEKRRINRIGKTRQLHEVIREKAQREINAISLQELKLVGTALYWGEGGKTNRGMARVANADPYVIKMIMRFFREVCEVPETKFRGHVHTFSHLNAETAEKYWSDISGVPLSQFYKTYTKPSVASLHKKDSLPYGTFQIYVCDTKLFLTIMGWIDGLKLQS